MCGIVAAVSNRNIVPVLAQGLQRRGQAQAGQGPRLELGQDRVDSRTWTHRAVG